MIEAGGQGSKLPHCPDAEGALSWWVLPRQPPALLVFVTVGQTSGRSQGFTTSENQHQLRNSGTTCLCFEVWLLVFTVLFLKCIKDV